MKYANKILLADMDGTLLDSKKQISARNIEALRYFTAHGGRFGVATGRSQSDAYRFLKDVPLNFHSIFQNGSILYDVHAKAPIKALYLPKEGLLPLINDTLQMHPTVGIQLHTVNHAYYLSNKEQMNWDYLANHSSELPFVTLREIQDENWTKILFSGNRDQLKWLEQHSKALIQNGRIHAVYSETYFFEVLPKSSNKGTMVKEIQKLMDAPHEIYAVGNFYNDLEMIQTADKGFLVDNAPQSLKELHDLICSHHDEDAIADIIYNHM